MKTSVKYLLKLFILFGFLIFGLLAGVKVGEVIASTPDPDPPGWVCGSSPGECVENYNVTICTWGPSGCDDGPAPPDQ